MFILWYLFLNDYLYFGDMLVYADYADGLVAGATHSSSDVLRAALQTVKTSENSKRKYNNCRWCWK